MFIYILNLLHDGLKKKNNIYKRSAFEIINDTMYISELACIKRSVNYENINSNILDAFKMLNIKYNLSYKDSAGILNNIIRNKNNSWFFEYYHKNNYNNKESDLILRLIINNVFEKTKRRDECI